MCVIMTSKTVNMKKMSIKQLKKLNLSAVKGMAHHPICPWWFESACIADKQACLSVSRAMFFNRFF